MSSIKFDPVTHGAEILGIHCLGLFRIEYAGNQIDSRGKIAELTLLLALSENRAMPRRDIAGFLWSDMEAERASHNLRQLLARLRAMPMGVAFDVSPQSVQLLEKHTTCDWWDFIKLSASLVHKDQLLATRLSQGNILGGFVPESENLAEWVEMWRRRMDEAVVALALRLGEAALDKGDVEQARDLGMQAIRIDNLREDAHRLVMRTLDAMDRRPEAIRHYDQLAALLEQELDSEPDELTQTLAASLKSESSVPSGTLPGLTIKAETNLESLSHRVHSLTTGFGALLALDVAGNVVDSTRTEFAKVSSFVSERLGGAAQETGLGRREILFKFASVREGAAAALACLKAFPASGLRGGLHLITDKHEFRGDSETAVRLTRLASQGNILLSLLARAQLVQDIDGTLTDLGDVAGAAETSRLHAFSLEKAVPQPELVQVLREDTAFFPTVAVVPLTAFGETPEGRIAGQLFAEELISGLGRHPELRVISRLSTISAQTHNMNPGQIRATLGASYAISGTCHIVGGTAHLMLELSDLNDSTSLWSEKVKVPFAEIYEINGVIDSIIGRIMSTLMRGKVQLVRQKGFAELNNCSLMLGAIAMMHHLSRANFDFSANILHHLIERNPGHPVPYSWLALHHLLRASQGWTDSHLREGELAQNAISQALDVDPENSLALTVQGHIQTQFHRDFDAARASYDTALASNPNNGMAWLFKSTMHAFRGEGEGAMDGASLASALSPLDPRRWFYDSLGATAALGAEQFETAIERAQRSIKANTLHTSTYRALAIAQVQAGQTYEARDTVQTLMKLQPGFTVAAYRANHPTGATIVGKTWAAALLEAGAPEG